jgi:diaminopimelate epimerase
MIHFTKYQGTGNDFIMVDNREMSFIPDKQTVSQLCDRRFGIGADGLILLEVSARSDFKMVYFNSDGNPSSMCGNGGRCLAHYAHSLGVCDKDGSFEAIDGLHEFTIGPSSIVKLRMKDVEHIESASDAYILDTGSPHYVVFADEILELPLVAEARKVRYNDRFRKDGINVNFVEVKENKYFMRTYERGVEDETLSCGTGTVAVALSIALSEDLKAGPVEINTPGGKLSVHFTRIDAGFSDIWLQGPAEKVFEGNIG